MSAANSKKQRGRPFAKGQSGNPNGRPKVAKDFQEMARKLAPEALERLAFWMRSENPKASPTASVVIVERAYGRAPQPLTGADGEKLTLGISIDLGGEPFRSLSNDMRTELTLDKTGHSATLAKLAKGGER